MDDEQLQDFARRISSERDRGANTELIPAATVVPLRDGVVDNEIHPPQLQHDSFGQLLALVLAVKQVHERGENSFKTFRGEVPRSVAAVQ